MNESLVRAGQTVVPEEDVRMTLADGERVYAYVKIPGQSGMDTVRVYSLTYWKEAIDKGWEFVQFYRGVNRVPIRRA